MFIPFSHCLLFVLVLTLSLTTAYASAIILKLDLKKTQLYFKLKINLRGHSYPTSSTMSTSISLDIDSPLVAINSSLPLIISPDVYLDMDTQTDSQDPKVSSFSFLKISLDPSLFVIFIWKHKARFYILCKIEVHWKGSCKFVV
jgi:hypothetical protein